VGSAVRHYQLASKSFSRALPAFCGDLLCGRASSGHGLLLVVLNPFALHIVGFFEGFALALRWDGFSIIK
jgi:hypothetical protein